MDQMVSVIMPVYNVEQYLRKSIESILNQTYQNFELLIVDDGSPDNSVEIIEKYIETDSRIRLLRKANGGLSDARNFGLQHAKGEYIYFFDSDDYIEPNLLEKTLNVAIENNSDVVIFGYFVDYVNQQEKVYQSNVISNGNGTYDSSSFNQININHNSLHMLGYAWNKLYSHQYIKELNHTFIKGVSLVEDILFNEKILTYAKSITFLDDALYHYIQRDRQTLGNTFYKDSYNLQLRAVDARKNILSSWKIPYHIIEKNVLLLEMNAIRFCCCNLFYIKNQLTFLKKYNYVKYMTFQCNKRIRYKKELLTNKKDKFLVFLIKNKLNLLIALIYFISSKLRKEFIN